MAHEAVTLNDSIQDAVVKLCEGNPGAMSVLMSFLQRNPGYAHRLPRLSALNVYGPRIWMLWKDACKEDEKEFDRLLVEDRIEEKIAEMKLSNAMFASGWDYYS